MRKKTMKQLLLLAFKNLTRHKKRTIITSIAIGFGIMMMIWMHGMLKWANNESIKNIKTYEFGNFAVSTKEFKEERKNNPVDLTLNPKEIEQITAFAEEIGIQASPRTAFKSMASYNRGFGLPYLVFAIDPLIDAKIYDINKKIIEGKYLTQESQGILVSSYCVKELGAKLNDHMIIETRTRYGTFQAIRLKITGIFHSPDPYVNRNYLFISRNNAERNFQLEGTATEITFSTPTSFNEPYLSQMQEKIKTSGLNHLTINKWQEFASDYLAVIKTEKGSTNIIMFFIFIIVAVGIINTMLMAVFERIREIGMVRALGMRDRDVIMSFIFESAGIGLIGSLIGLILGIGISAYSIYFGLDFTSMYKDMDIGYRTGLVFYNEWNPEMMLTAVLFTIICSIIVSIIPARKAVKMEITDSIRYI
jgi:ABC-type lipoprotein release transport system permease subunit